VSAPVADRVPILMYHQVSNAPRAIFLKYTVTGRAFAAQMKWLAANGYSTIDLPTLLARHRGGAPIPEKRTVVITFDDGFRDCANVAAPVMEAYGFSATFFLVAGLMGDSSRWLMTERGIEFPIMSWDDARQLERAGHRCESHSMTHPRLADLSPGACRDELARARAMLEDELGHPVRYLAYPFGSESQQTRDIAADCGYDAACTVAIGISAADDDVYALPRVPVLGTDSLRDFASRMKTAYTVRDRLRRMMGVS
jgi:peptidoglycan/xylan/chitin deacetylase (PgdA/CDA1 family)